jgi:hypothetical protein
MPKDTWEEGTQHKKSARDYKESNYDKQVWQKERTYKYRKYQRLEDKLKEKKLSKDEKREITRAYEDRLEHFRERIDFTFEDWDKEDWDQIRNLRDMRESVNKKSDRYNKPTLNRPATIDQTRLVWEHVKGYTHPKLRDGTYTFQITGYGIRARSDIVHEGKTYKKGQFIPGKYLEKIQYLMR